MQLPFRVNKLIETLLGTPGESDMELRRAIFEETRAGAGGARGPRGAELRVLVEKIDQHPWMIGDDDFQKLRAAGYSEDQIFELTVAAALGAGVRRFEAGLRSLAAAEAEVGGGRGDR